MSGSASTVSLEERGAGLRSLWKMMRLISTICVVLLIAGTLVFGNLLGWQIPEWHLSDQSRQTAWVDTDAVNLRAGPSTDAEVLDVLVQGTRVSVTGTSSGGFAPVIYDGQTAWIFDEFLSRSVDESSGNVASAAEPEQDTSTGEAPVESGSDNTRSEAVEPDTEVAEVTGEHWIEVDRSSAMITLHIGETAQASFKGKIGRDPSDDGFYSTAVGTYFVYTKNPGLTSTPFVADVYMTDFVGFDPNRHNGFHSPIRDATGALLPSQNATTLGCVRLEEEAAKELFAFAYIGMRVEIHN